jgi:adenylylsulfate kinase-like enzyme
MKYLKNYWKKFKLLKYKHVFVTLANLQQKMILLLAGLAGSGKDTLADYIVNKYINTDAPFVKYNFASAVRYRICLTK